MPLFKRKFQAPTAYSFNKIVEDYGDGRFLIDLWQWDCWGIVYPGSPRRLKVGDKEKKDFGWHNFITLDMLKAGCCPPILKEGFLETKEAPG